MAYTIGKSREIRLNPSVFLLPQILSVTVSPIPCLKPALIIVTALIRVMFNCVITPVLALYMNLNGMAVRAWESEDGGKAGAAGPEIDGTGGSGGIGEKQG